MPISENRSVLVPLIGAEQDQHLNSSEDELLLHSISQNINEAIYRSMYGKGLVYINDAISMAFSII